MFALDRTAFPLRMLLGIRKKPCTCGKCWLVQDSEMRRLRPYDLYPIVAKNPGAIRSDTHKIDVSHYLESVNIHGV